MSLPKFSATAWAKRGSTSYNVDGNMWAPDVIWNKAMKKWCMYLSVNGDNWYSSIILLTADNIEGPYLYQAPVVMSGFHTGTSYKDTDLEVVSVLRLRCQVAMLWAATGANVIPTASTLACSTTRMVSYGYRTAPGVVVYGCSNLMRILVCVTTMWNIP